MRSEYERVKRGAVSVELSGVKDDGYMVFVYVDGMLLCAMFYPTKPTHEYLADLANQWSNDYEKR